jgi:molybdopterin synthase catalytic subunit
LAVCIQEKPFDVSAEISNFGTKVESSGAIVTFTGIVRNDSGALDHMIIEHYPAMTQIALQKFTELAIDRFELEDALIIHRHGTLKPKEIIMMIATAAPHRQDAFAGAQFLMDCLKSRAPFWKKEISEGLGKWVEPRAKDEFELGSWVDNFNSRMG